MIKLIRTADTRWNEKVATHLKVTRFGAEFDGMIKTAGAVLAKEFAELRPSDKYAWVHTLAVGSTEAYGPNRNADGFSEFTLQKKHPTFVKNGNVYRNHANKDPKKRIGIIKASAYNPEMRRAELIVGYDKKLAPDIVAKVANDEDIAGSMGCHIEYDVCSICQHKAPTPKHYCKCMKTAAAQILSDGRQVFVDNPEAEFFDWSYVGRGADRIALSFDKVAVDLSAWTSAVDLASEVGLWLPSHLVDLEGRQRRQLKLAVLHKLSEMEKEIPAKLTPIDKKIGESMEDSALEDSDVDRLKKVSLPSAMSALHNAQVILPVKDFIKLITNRTDDDLSDIGDDVQGVLPGVFGRMLDDEDSSALDNNIFDGDGEAGGPLQDLVKNLIPQLGMGAGPLGHRVTISVIRGPKKVAAAPAGEPLPEIETLARLYATYKLAAVTHPRNEHDVVLTRAAVLQNYHHSI